MKPDRWRELESLYNRAAEMDESRRVEFLREACAGDGELRNDVERLLAAGVAAASFLEQPALQEIAHEFASTAGPPHHHHQYWIGRQVGNYQFVSFAGSGGMGEVYRARDTKLEREVAIKVIPDEFSRDPERITRFQREAQLLASLNHPNIAAVYDLEELNESRLLILEMVEGETLADRIHRGSIPLDEALTIALQIAEALEAAHEKSIIHRDLKPANIKVTPEGKVKVLDFGLAKAFEPQASLPNMSQSPTISTAATIHGVILGTAAYMSPEQAKGKDVDRRTDIFAFGAVLYEMLTGHQAFDGEDVAEILTAVMTREPAHNALPADTPAVVRNLLRRCLDKNLKRRLQHIGEARILIEDALPGAASAGPAGPDAVPRRRRGWLAWASAALVLTIAPAIGFVLRDTKPQAAIRLSADIGVDAQLYTAFGASAIFSPNGAQMVLVASGADQKRRIYVRSLDALQATMLPGTENARNPFFSPHGEWIGFFADGKLKKISIQGGAVAELSDAPDDRGGTWGEDGVIVFTPNQTTGLSKVSSAGGAPEPLTPLDQQAGEGTQRWPQILPGGRAILFTSNARTNNYEDSEIVVYSIATRQRKTILYDGFYARYLPSGHVAYVHEGTLLTVPFDLQRLEVTGQPVATIEGVATSPASGGAQFSFSETGSLAYVAGPAGRSNVSIYWMNRGGNLTTLREPPGDYYNPAFSPDGKRVALDIVDGGRRDVWVYEWERDNIKRLTFDGDTNGFSAWTPDGERIVYSSQKKYGAHNLYTLWLIRSDGSGDAHRLAESRSLQYTPSWRPPDGKVLAFRQSNADTGWDIMTLTIEGDEKSGWKPGEPKPFINSASDERDPAFSPDGRWLAYVSNELGTYDVYVRPFPDTGGKWQISTGGGNYPKWSSNGKELVYRTGDRKMLMVTTYTASNDNIRFDKPRPWAPAQFADRINARTFDLHPDGKRFAVLKTTGKDQFPESNKISFIFNFFDVLRGKLPGKN